MTTEDKLRALRRLRYPADIRNYSDWCDIGTYIERCGPDFDATMLDAKAVERIDIIFGQHFEVVG